MTNGEILKEISDMDKDDLDKVNIYSLIKNREAQENYWDIQKIIIVVTAVLAGLAIIFK